MLYKRLMQMKAASLRTSGAQTVAASHAAAAQTYERMLDICERFFSNELDNTAFEERLRGLFGTKAYHIYTIDKLIASMVRLVGKLS